MGDEIVLALIASAFIILIPVLIRANIENRAYRARMTDEEKADEWKEHIW